MPRRAWAQRWPPKRGARGQPARRGARGQPARRGAPWQPARWEARGQPAQPCDGRRRDSFGLLRELLGLVLLIERADELFEMPVHDLIELVEREVDAMVGDAALREVVGADALGAVARADLELARLRLLALLTIALIGE